MGFTPRMGTCKMCGKEMMVNSPCHRFCKDCAKRRRNQRSREYHRNREVPRKAAIERGTDPGRYKGLDHECKVKNKCMYGAPDCCMYMAVEGHSRLLAGYPIRGGKCGAYRTGKRKVVRQKTPVAGPVLYSGKMSEV